MLNTYAEKYVRTRDGLRLYYRDHGDPRSGKVPVLCLPGSSSNVRSFEHVAPRLAEQRRVLCMDWRGHGRSAYDGDWRNYGFATDRDDVLDLLAHEKIPQVVVLGTSRGGIIAPWIAAHRPGVLAGAILNDIGPVGAADGAGSARLRRNFGLPTEFNSFEEAARALKDRQVPGIALSPAGWLRHARQYFRMDSDGRVRPDFDPGYTRHFTEMKGVRDDWDKFAALARVPTLAIRGALSDIIDQPTLDEMMRRKPDLQVCLVHGRAHCPYLDEPEAIEALDAFLAKV